MNSSTDRITQLEARLSRAFGSETQTVQTPTAIRVSAVVPQGLTESDRLALLADLEERGYRYGHTSGTGDEPTFWAEVDSPPTTPPECP
ncbi:hypothetical protein [Streptomyces sp. NBC_00470]|uniref:hypothetical protein n=1 Tax=Streptomyces sp. NBC_00470 TaxID=2975753 RepID=UPI002F918B5C